MWLFAGNEWEDSHYSTHDEAGAPCLAWPQPPEEEGSAEPGKVLYMQENQVARVRILSYVFREPERGKSFVSLVPIVQKHGLPLQEWLMQQRRSEQTTMEGAEAARRPTKRARTSSSTAASAGGEDAEEVDTGASRLPPLRLGVYDDRALQATKAEELLDPLSCYPPSKSPLSTRSSVTDADEYLMVLAVRPCSNGFVWPLFWSLWEARGPR